MGLQGLDTIDETGHRVIQGVSYGTIQNIAYRVHIGRQEAPIRLESVQVFGKIHGWRPTFVPCTTRNTIGNIDGARHKQ